MTPGARFSTAIELLNEIRSAGRRPADAVASVFFRQRRYIGSGDRRFISIIVWGVLRHWRRIHWHLIQQKFKGEEILKNLFSAKKEESDEESFFSSREICLAFSVMGTGSVKALQASFGTGKYAAAPLSKNELTLLSRLEGLPFDHQDQSPAVRGEYPDWLSPLLEESFGSPEKIAKEVAAMQAEAPLDIRVNLLKATREEALSVLRKADFPAEISPLSPWGIRLPSRSAIMSLDFFKNGIVEIQDEGSQIVALLANAKPGQRVVDYCAGAGGKTMAMAMNMENRGKIVACDVSEVRLNGAVKRLRRAGVHNVERHLLVEGDKWLKRHKKDFDLVVIDAPCTGTGTWRRNPDARRTLAPIDLEEIMQKQEEVLEKASSLLKIGGCLLYATCSILADENEKRIEKFLKTHPDFQMKDPATISVDLPEILKKQLQEKGYIRLTPAQHETDGFFACLLERKEAD
ncbi:RsmB/NOP family class I SAM-dependent RNA methyltransferase [Acetobacteraceae bacterium]|nr:RsmB/NOP family class I SAM-dependent RNA methyltransferase [Acetobacteraceae bacterium]